MKTLTLIATLTLLLTACGGAGSSGGCAVNDLLNAGAVRQFIDAEAVARSTARVSLAPIVRDLQAAQAALSDEDWPDCGAETKAAFDTWMSKQIEVYLAFMRDEYIYVQQRLQYEARTAWEAAMTSWTALIEEQVE